MAAIQLLAFEGAYRSPTFCTAAHGHKSEPAWSTGDAICDEVHISNGSMLSEQILQIRVGSTKRKISNVEFHSVVIERMLATKPFPITGLQITIEKNQLTIFRAMKKKANEHPTLTRIAQNARESLTVPMVRMALIQKFRAFNPSNKFLAKKLGVNLFNSKPATNESCE
jgi:hypothetical protein